MYMPHTKDLKETKSFDEHYITKEQRLQAEHLVTKGFETYIEGPYYCKYHDKNYCYIWAVKLGTSRTPLRIDGRGFNIN